MTERPAHDETIARLAALAASLDVDDADLVDEVLDRIARPAELPAPARPLRHVWLVAAATVALAVGFVAHPAGRGAMARWFGLDGVSVQVDPTLPVTRSAETFAAPGPGESQVVIVDGREVLFSAVDGRLFEEGITKTVQSSDQISEVRVGDHPGLWIAGGSHQVAYESPDGDMVVTRVASDTLLWQDGPVLFRVEGFDDLADAVEFASGT
jgi:hypothetical protein